MWLQGAARNKACPCGSKRKYKSCCGTSKTKSTLAFVSRSTLCHWELALFFHILRFWSVKNFSSLLCRWCSYSDYRATEAERHFRFVGVQFDGLQCLCIICHVFGSLSQLRKKFLVDSLMHPDFHDLKLFYWYCSCRLPVAQFVIFIRLCSGPQFIGRWI